VKLITYSYSCVAVDNINLTDTAHRAIRLREQCFFLPTRRYVSAGTSHGLVSVCLSVCHKSEFYIKADERIGLDFGMTASFHRYDTVFKGNSGISENMVLPLELRPKLRT